VLERLDARQRLQGTRHDWRLYVHIGRGGLERRRRDDGGRCCLEGDASIPGLLTAGWPSEMQKRRDPARGLSTLVARI